MAAEKHILDFHTACKSMPKTRREEGGILKILKIYIYKDKDKDKDKALFWIGFKNNKH